MSSSRPTAVLTCASSQIVMRISRADADDPTGRRRRHFEISIDSPFSVLNCRATQANTALPQYTGSYTNPLPSHPHPSHQQLSCGCRDAPPLDNAHPSPQRPLNMIEENFLSLAGRRLHLDTSSSSSAQPPPGFPAPPRAAHLPSSSYNQQNSPPPPPLMTPVGVERPIHLLRHPSHNPPAFDDDVAPPALLPLMTPPPNYDLIVGTPSVDGLADYFARLAEYEGMASPTGTEDGGDGSGGGDDINVPGVEGNSEEGSDSGTIGPDTEPASPTRGVLPQAMTDSPVEDVGAFRGLPSGGTSTTTTPETTSPLTAAPPSALPTAPPTQPPHPSSSSPHPTAGAVAGPVPTATPSGIVPTYDFFEDDEDDDDEEEEHQDGRARLHRRGRVHVANPRTPGGRLVPSRSMEIERPVVRLDMSGVLERRAARGN